MIQKIKNNKILHILYRVLEFIVFGALILYVVAIAFQRFSDNQSIFGYRVFTIASGSMNPAYKVGDVILVKETTPEELRVGDVITYLGNKSSVSGMIVTHRITKIETKSNGSLLFTIKGDANQVEDPVIDSSQIYGKVTMKLTLITLISNVIHNQFGFFFLIFIPIVLFIFLEVADTIMDMREEKKREKEGTPDEREEE